MTPRITQPEVPLCKRWESKMEGHLVTEWLLELQLILKLKYIEGMSESLSDWSPVGADYTSLCSTGEDKVTVVKLNHLQASLSLTFK